MNSTDYTLPLDATPWRLIAPNTDTREWCVLWLQGFSSTIEGHTEGLLRLSSATDTPFAMLNYAGHGDHPTSLDDATQEQQLAEVIGVYDELMKRGYKKIIIIGGSFGAFMAALLVGKRPAEALVLRAPANYHESEFELAYKDTAERRKDRNTNLYRQNLSADFTNNAVESVRHFAGIAYIIEHEQDDVIHPSVPRSYFGAARHGNYISIPGLKHSPKLMSNPQEYFAVIELWLTTIVNATKRIETIQKRSPK